MRINIYAEDLSDERRVKLVMDVGGRLFGVRIFLKSPDELHDEPGDDDRSAVTFWGPRARMAALLREAADMVDKR